jgi:hypothetical protein
MQLAPVSPSLITLQGKHVDHPHSWNSVKDSIVAFFEKETAVWELRFQPCTNLTKMPVEDASVEWDEHLSFNPWHSLASHRPLGSIMRARFKSYQASSQFRHTAEGRPMVEPRSIEELPG